MKVKIYNTETEMSEEEVLFLLSRAIEDASAMQGFIRFLEEYVELALKCGDGCRWAMLEKLHECLSKYKHYKHTIKEAQATLEKERAFFWPEAAQHIHMVELQLKNSQPVGCSPTTPNFSHFSPTN